MAGQAEAGGRPGIHKYLYERISMCLSDHDDVGIVIADKPGGGSVQETQWLAGTLQLTNAGTQYVTPDRIVLPIVTAPSHHVPHLQLADVVTAATTTAAVAGRPSGLQLREPLPAVPTSMLLATPAELASSLARQPNLLHWVFGKTVRALPSALSGYDLPEPDWKYGTDDGLAEVVTSG